MKHLLLASVLLLGLSAQAQTYPKYTGQKANETKVSKPRIADSKPESTDAATVSQKLAEKPKADFQDLMNRGGVFTVDKDYKRAVGMFTLALAASEPDTAWRALLSRATSYDMLKMPKEALTDLTTIINDYAATTPEKKLAYIYLMRSRILAEKGDMDLACNDVQKGKELGLPENETSRLDCD